MMQRQAEHGRFELKELEDAWCGRRDGMLKWLCALFDAHLLKDEWFLATVALLDRSVVAQPSKQMKTFHIDALAAALAALKLCEAEAVFSCGIRELVCTLGKGVSARFRDMWADIVKAERRLCQALEWNVGAPSTYNLALNLALEISVLACDTCRDWEGLSYVRLTMPGHEPSLPEPVFIAVMRYILELSVLHAPAIVYRSGSPGIVPLAALHLALKRFGRVPARCAECLREQQERLLQVGEATQLAEVMEQMFLLWRAPPFASEVKLKWSKRALRSNRQFVYDHLDLLEPPSDLLDFDLAGGSTLPPAETVNTDVQKECTDSGTSSAPCAVDTSALPSSRSEAPRSPACTDAARTASTAVDCPSSQEKSPGVELMTPAAGSGAHLSDKSGEKARRNDGTCSSEKSDNEATQTATPASSECLPVKRRRSDQSQKSTKAGDACGSNCKVACSTGMKRYSSKRPERPRKKAVL
jgi:hypothetical protein